MTDDIPRTVICRYQIREGAEEEFLALMKRHWTTLHHLGLVSSDPPLHYAGRDEENKSYFIEIFTWDSPDAVRTAHEHPEVAKIWEPMAQHCEERLGRPAMQFPHVRPLALELAPA